MRHVPKEALEDAARLKQIWNERKDELHLSQAQAAKEMGYTSQGAVSQYLNGRVALNFEAAAKFAKLLRVELPEISPRFAPLVSRSAPSELESYRAPPMGAYAGSKVDESLSWFAFSNEFAGSLGVPIEHLRLVKLRRSGGSILSDGAVVLIDDRDVQEPLTGTFLLRDGDGLIVRQIEVLNDVVTLSDGVNKAQQLSKELFPLLRVVGKIIFELRTV